MAAPSRTGFGTELAGRMSASLGGVCEFVAPEGLAVRVAMKTDQATV
ncbi:two-component sensor histidine kinase [Pseudorhizobium tarimense]|uniref:Two-component sensor histidine kinase n=1 Tax=Pseudorhizobium tarimense TaxID=1079109 RepID=A0ABV2HA29_9HYPH|nr:hypothetical protein [Pseudorhizobium tarimense]MCJ8520588.1 hypothetical protein [Pseudorhizobium tarimense]